MDIAGEMVSEGADIFYDPDFRNVLEDHVTLLQNDAATEVVVVTPNVAYKFERDLYGYLSSLGNVPQYLFWITMRVNGFASETDFLNPTRLLIPHKNSVNKLKQMYEASTTNK